MYRKINKKLYEAIEDVVKARRDALRDRLRGPGQLRDPGMKSPTVLPKNWEAEKRRRAIDRFYPSRERDPGRRLPGGREMDPGFYKRPPGGREMDPGFYKRPPGGIRRPIDKGPYRPLPGGIRRPDKVLPRGPKTQEQRQKDYEDAVADSRKYGHKIHHYSPDEIDRKLGRRKKPEGARTMEYRIPAGEVERRIKGRDPERHRRMTSDEVLAAGDKIRARGRKSAEERMARRPVETDLQRRMREREDASISGAKRLSREQDQLNKERRERLVAGGQKAKEDKDRASVQQQYKDIKDRESVTAGYRKAMAPKREKEDRASLEAGNITQRQYDNRQLAYAGKQSEIPDPTPAELAKARQELEDTPEERASRLRQRQLDAKIKRLKAKMDG